MPGTEGAPEVTVASAKCRALRRARSTACVWPAGRTGGTDALRTTPGDCSQQKGEVLGMWDFGDCRVGGRGLERDLPDSSKIMSKEGVKRLPKYKHYYNNGNTEITTSVS